MKRYFPVFGVLLYVGMTPQTVIRLHSVWVRDMSGTCRFWFGIVSADFRQFGIMSGLIWSWIGARSADICPMHSRSKTDKPSTIGGRIKTETPPNDPRQTYTTPAYNRQKTDNLSGRDHSNMIETSLHDKCVCPSINRHQTDKTKSIPTVNRSLPDFEDFCRFEVGFVSVWPVWLGC